MNNQDHPGNRMSCSWRITTIGVACFLTLLVRPDTVNAQPSSTFESVQPCSLEQYIAPTSEAKIRALRDSLKEDMRFAFQAGERELLLSILCQAAAANIVDAERMLGVLLAEGTNLIEQDEAQARYWIGRAAQQDDIVSYYWLGEFHQDGRGGPVNLAEAAGWYWTAAPRGNADAQFQLGGMYLAGDVTGIPSFGKGAYWVARAAQLGHPQAPSLLDIVEKQLQATWPSTELGRPLAAGECGQLAQQMMGSGDSNRATFRLMMGTMEWNGECAYNLGMISLIMGQGEETYRYLYIGSIHGHAAAQYMLGDWYADDRGPEPNHTQARFWFGTSAKAGNADARKKCLELGIDYTSPEYGLSDENRARWGY
jgi:TPR repeat protein